MKMTAKMYGTKLMAYDAVSGRTILATVKDSTAAFADWQIDTIEQDKLAPAAVLAKFAAMPGPARDIEVA